MNYNSKSIQYQYLEGGFVQVRASDRDDGTFNTHVAMRLESGAKAPKRAHPDDAGADMFAYLGPDLDGTHSVTLEPGEQALIDTGVALKIPRGYAGFLMPRSSMRAKRITSWGDGLIDAQYRGTIKVVVANMGKLPYVVNHGDKIAQLVIQKVELVGFTDIWNDTDRGAGGFGSTGNE